MLCLVLHMTILLLVLSQNSQCQVSFVFQSCWETVFIISWLLHTHCDLIILKHLIGEKGQPYFFSFSWKQDNCIIFYFIFKWKEENIQAHIDIIFLLRATIVPMFMFAAMTIQHMNKISSMPWRLLKWWFRLSTHCCYVHTKQTQPGNMPQTHIFQYIKMQPQ